MNLLFLERGVKLSFSPQKVAYEFTLSVKKKRAPHSLQMQENCHFPASSKNQPIEFVFFLLEVYKF